MTSLIDPITLPCGLRLQNRLLKVAMAERLADSKLNNLVPQQSMFNLYDRWARGSWGMIITGNVMVSERYLGMPEDMTINSTSLEDPTVLRAWITWAESAQKYGIPALVQLNHPGRQSALGSGKRGLFEKTLSSSPTPLDFGKGVIPTLMRQLVFGTPKQMTDEDIDDTIAQFVSGALLAQQAGFKGIELHGAHGYLLAQFLSSKVINKRTDFYGGTPERRAFIVKRIVASIRKTTGPEFCIGIKLNSTDYQHDGVEGMKALQAQVKTIAATSIDFIEVSGGTFENPEFFIPNRQSTKDREAYFLPFAAAIREACPRTPIMITGGFRSRPGMDSALQSGSCDLIGTGRLSILCPGAPKESFLACTEGSDEPKVTIESPPMPGILKLLGLESMFCVNITEFYTQKMWNIAQA